MMFAGTERYPWPLSDRDAAERTCWLPCKQGIAKVTPVPKRSWAPRRCHGVCNPPSAGLMRVRLLRLRSLLEKALLGGIDLGVNRER